jgi:hypothetical protein
MCISSSCSYEWRHYWRLVVKFWANAYWFARMMYPFFAGVITFPYGKLIQVKCFFCSLWIIIALAMKLEETSIYGWMVFMIQQLLFSFPLIIFLAASGEIKVSSSDRYVPFWWYILSYVYYHYQSYTYMHWAVDNKIEQRSIPCEYISFLSFCCACVPCLNYDDLQDDG